MKKAGTAFIRNPNMILLDFIYLFIELKPSKCARDGQLSCIGLSREN